MEKEYKKVKEIVTEEEANAWGDAGDDSDAAAFGEILPEEKEEEKEHG